MLSELCLEHEATLGSLIEEISAVSKTIVAELLGNTLSIRPLWTILNKIVQEAQYLKVETLQTVILIIIQLLSNLIIIALQEVLTLLIRSLLIFHRVELILLIHLLLQLVVVGAFHLSDSSLIELVHGHILRLLVDLFKFGLQHGASLRELIVEALLENLEGIHHGFLTLVLTNVGPR